MMRIAVITGASSGLGVQFAKAVARTRGEIDEIWLVARREDKLKENAQSFAKPCRIFSMDLTQRACADTIAQTASDLGARVCLLINNAGFGKLGNFKDIRPEDNADMVTLNCEAVTYLTARLLPLMEPGAEIINSCSIAAFAPNTRMAVYSSTKAYILSLSKALRSELKSSGIHVLAACPGPMDTEFLPLAGIEKGSSHTFDTLPRVRPEVMAEKALKASAKHRGVYTNLLFYKFYRLLAKLLPHRLVMKLCGA